MQDKWKFNNIFEIALDSTISGYMVGEVELQNVGEIDTVFGSRAAEGMDTEIEAFMQKYSWAFPPRKVDGKLLTYFTQQSSSESINIQGNVFSRRGSQLLVDTQCFCQVSHA